MFLEDRDGTVAISNAYQAGCNPIFSTLGVAGGSTCTTVRATTYEPVHPSCEPGPVSSNRRFKPVSESYTCNGPIASCIERWAEPCGYVQYLGHTEESAAELSLVALVFDTMAALAAAWDELFLPLNGVCLSMSALFLLQYDTWYR